LGCCSLLLVGRTGRSSHPSSIKMSTLYTCTRDKGFLASTRECSARPHTDQQGSKAPAWAVKASTRWFITSGAAPNCSL
jgi:hypothetical protein